MKSNNKNLLLIEDNQIDQMAFKRFAANKEFHYNFDIASSIKEARSLLKSKKYDVIVADYSLGDGTAFDILKEFENIPMVITTGTGNENIAVKAMKKGAYDYLIKDVDSFYLKMLPVTVENTISRFQMADELRKYHENLEIIVEQRTSDLTNEIAERKQVEEALQLSMREITALNTLGQQVSSNLSINQVVQAALEGIFDPIKPDLALIFLRDKDKLFVQGAKYKDSKFQHKNTPVHKVGECLCGVAVSNKKALYSLNIKKDPRCTWDECKNAGLISFVALPLFSGDKIIGVLGIGSVAERDFSKQATFLETISNQISSGLQNAMLYEQLVDYTAKLEKEIVERKRTENELKDAKERYDFATEAGKVGTWDWNTLTGELLWNDEVYRILGFYPGEVVPTYQLFLDLLHPEDREFLEKAVQKALDEKVPYNLDCRIITKDGKVNVCQAIGKVMFDDDGKPIRMIGVFLDITERKQVEDELQMREQQLRLIYDSTGDSIYYLKVEHGLHYRFISVNRAFLKNTGLSREQIIGKTINEVIPEPSIKLVRSNYQKAIKENRIMHWEETTQYPAGLITGIVSIAPVYDDNGNCTHLVGAVHDITERKKIEEALELSRTRYKTLFNDSPAPLWEEEFSELYKYLDELKEKGINDLRAYFDDNPADLLKCVKKVKIIEVNKATLNLHQAKTKEQLLGNFDKIFTEKSLDVFKEEVLAISEGQLEFESEAEVKTLSGEPRHIVLKLRFEKEQTSSMIALLATIDITKRKLAEEELLVTMQNLEKSRLQLRELNIHAQNIREKERADISREIHDVFGQALTALKLDISWIKKKAEISNVEVLKTIDEMNKLIDETTTSVQRISTELRPALLDDLGLSYALEWQCNEFSRRSGIKSTLEIFPEQIKLNEKISVVLFRIVQESLTNVARHSKAASVIVSLSKINDTIELKIIDNGIGIKAKEKDDPKALGLLGIVERAITIKGKVSFSGKHDIGTEVKVVVQLENEGEQK